MITLKRWYGGLLPGTQNNKSANEIFDKVVTDQPLAVLAFGSGTHESSKRLTTSRPNGRKDYTISYLFKGDLLVTPNKIHIKENSIVLYKPNQPQFTTLFDQNPATTYWVHFSGSNVEQLLQKYGLDSGIIKFNKPFPFFKEIVDRMYVAKANPFYQDICNCLLMELFMYIGGNSKTTSTTGNYQRLLQYMKETCTENLPIKAYADFIGFSEVYFVRFFKKASTLTPHAYLIRLRLEKACEMLLHTDIPINQIADTLGYKTARYFSKVFFDRYGLTPSEYRKGKRL